MRYRQFAAYAVGVLTVCRWSSRFSFVRDVVASWPLTQRAFRRPAGRRVTFLLLAQKKS